MKTIKLIPTITFLLVIFSCSSKPDRSDYLGTWTNGNDVMNISQVGEDFLVVGHDDGIYTISKEKKLIRPGQGNTISYDKKNTTLILSTSISGLDKWTRLKDENGDQTTKNELAGKTGKIIKQALISGLVILVLVIIFIWIIHSKDARADDLRLENEIREINRKRRMEEQELERKRRMEEEELKKQQKIEKETLYGPLTREIAGYSSLPVIELYDEKDVIFIGDRELKYKMILGYNLDDNTQTITQGGNMQAKTSTGSMLGRGIVGGVLLGGVGALAGAATAKKNIQTDARVTTTRHSYKVHIYIASPTDPLLTIECGAYNNYARDLAATLNYIIHKNNS
ncbi:MAG: hypothetical protein PHG64_12445 [Paludibacter sp.]|nr:hypothetical protein [Paludibacter sp.]